MTNYKATPEQWEVQEKFAPESEDACCLLELRSRIERLELGAGIHDAVIGTLKPPTLTDLSPAAQAILDAWESEWSKKSLCHDQHSIAAALRAVVDQLGYSNVPEEFVHSRPLVIDSDDLLSIAAELEAL
jgi:hypothetical protein